MRAATPVGNQEREGYSVNRKIGAEREKLIYIYIYIFCFSLVTMRIYVHVREKVIALECGDGTQDVIWLGNAAMVHYDASFGRKYGSPNCIQKEGGITCDPEARVCDLLDDNQHVFAVLDGDD
ncbi:hypothetical protein TRSC58_02321, partial [Trypanosoma rangeli SC58]